ncbi:unnamed protein product, partial [Choristocarpus tenellus]
MLGISFVQEPTVKTRRDVRWEQKTDFARRRSQLPGTPPKVRVDSHPSPTKNFHVLKPEITDEISSTAPWGVQSSGALSSHPEGSSGGHPFSKDGKGEIKGTPVRPRDLFESAPKPGQDPVFDAKVTAELQRIKANTGEKLSEKGRDVPLNTKCNQPDGDSKHLASGNRSDEFFAKPLDRTFEEDVQHAMVKLIDAPFHGGGSLRDLSAGEGGILSQMDMHRASHGLAGKGRATGLKGMWDGDTTETFPSSSRPRRTGTGLKGMWEGGTNDPSSPQHSNRQGSGLKGMWNGEVPPAAPARPQRQGPGLRGLWSGADTALADAARSDSQAAYHRALDSDLQERQISASKAEGEDREYRRRDLEQATGGIKYSSNTQVDQVLGTVRGGQWTSPRQPLGLGEREDRLAMKAKQEAYAEELRKQMAENQARKAREMAEAAAYDQQFLAGHGNGRSDGSRLTCPGTDGALQLTNPAYPSSRSPVTTGSDSVMRGRPQELYSKSDKSTIHEGRSKQYLPLPDAQQQPPVQPPEQESSWENREDVRRGTKDLVMANVSVARRRLVEDVYGGGGMGAALGFNSGRRERGTYESGRSDSRDGYRGSAITLQGQGFADPELHQGHLRTGLVLRGRDPVEMAGQERRRSAALEQQRALQEQIMMKQRAKEEEEARRKQEDMEDLRRQEEWQQQMEKEAEAQKRQRQAEQQEQLQGLYRQQELALQKRRSGGPRNSSAPAPSSGGSGQNSPQSRDHSNRLGIYSSPISPQGGQSIPHSREYVGVSRIDDLPAGAFARAEVKAQHGSDRPARIMREEGKADEGMPIGGMPFDQGVGSTAGDMGSTKHLPLEDKIRMSRGATAMTRPVWDGRRKDPTNFSDEEPLPTRTSLHPIPGFEDTMPARLGKAAAWSKRSAIIKGVEVSPQRTCQGEQDQWEERRGLLGRSGQGKDNDGRGPTVASHDEMDAFVTSWDQSHLQDRHAVEMSGPPRAGSSPASSRSQGGRFIGQRGGLREPARMSSPTSPAHLLKGHEINPKKSLRERDFCAGEDLENSLAAATCFVSP